MAIEVWFRVDITFKHIESASSKTLIFSNRPLIGNVNAGEYYPILDSISGCGLMVGQQGLPVVSTGSVTVNDSFNSIGEELRVCDYLEEWSPIEQDVVIYDACTDLGDLDPGGDYTTRWKGKVTSVNKTFGEPQQVIFAVESMKITPKTIGTEIDFDDFTIAETDGRLQNASGRFLPMIFGSNIQNVAIQAEYGNAGNSRWAANAYPQTLYSPQMMDASRIYFEDDEGNFRNIKEAGSGGLTHGVGYQGATTTTAHGATEYAYLVTQETDDAYLITGGKWLFHGQGSVYTPAGEIIFTLYELSGAGTNVVPEGVAGRAVVNKSTYHTELAGSDEFYITFTFERPIVMKNDGREPNRFGYALSYHLSEYTGNPATDFKDGDHGAHSNITKWTKLSGGSWGTRSSTDDYATFSLTGLLWNDTSIYGNLHEGYYVRGIWNDNSQSVVANAITNMSGVRDLLSGVITGTANDIITLPHHVVKALTMDWNGTNWGLSSEWDWDAFSTIHQNVFEDSNHTYYRKIDGFLDGRSTLEDWLGALCREAACKVVQRTNGKFALWAWGDNQTSVKTYSDEDIYEFRDYQRLDSASVINDIKLKGGKQYVDYNIGYAGSEGSFANYSLTTNWTKDTSAYTNALMSASQQIYGDRELAITELDLLNDSRSMGVLAEHYAREHDQPHTTFSIVVDYWENRTIELMDLVDVVSAYLPSTAGTTLQGREAHYGEQYITAHEGNYTVRAQRYDCRVISRQIDWRQGQIPRLTLGLRILKPYHKNAIY